MRPRLIPASFIISVILTTLTGCSDTDKDGKTSRPPTIFEEKPPKPRTDQVKIDNFIVQLEKKYKREAIRNTTDLHFSGGGSGRIQVRITYDRTSNPTTANSIGDAAIELAKRLKREDPDLRDVDITFDRVVERRDE